MSVFLITLSVYCLCLLLYGSMELRFGLNKLPILLNESQPTLDTVRELVSVIMVVKDEEKHIESTVKCMLNQDYPSLEIIVVDDRSADKTPNILKKRAKKYSVLKLLTIQTLPEGWLGKNHAMFQGARLAKGKWLLFLDGDVFFSPKAISLGMNYMQRERINNLTLIPEFKRKNFWLDALISSGALAFYFKLKPWRAAQINPNYYAGIGAYNLFSKENYFKFNGHQSFPMCILDDIKLGKQLKVYGAKQRCLDGAGLISLNWYDSVSEMVYGTEKNSFAHCRFNLLRLAGESILGLCLFLWPIIALFVMESNMKWLNLVSILTTMRVYAFYAKLKNLSAWQMLAYPFGVVVGTYAWWRSAIRILKARGVCWRDTFYSLSELKKDLL